MTRASRFGIAAVAIVLILALAIVGSGCYLSNLIRDDGFIPNHDEPMLDLIVTAVEDGSVTLQVTNETDEDGEWRRDGLYGLISEGGYDQVGLIIEITDEYVTRELSLLFGELEVGESARLDGFTFPDDPQKAHGFPYEIVSFTSPLGEFPAWFVDGERDTWAIFVHGRNSHMREGLRILPTLVDAGYPTLLISYRNDKGSPANPDGFHRYGLTEWEEVEGAVRFAQERGASEIILIGFSMGGGTVVNFLSESSLATSVKAVILDAPMLSLSAVTDFEANRRGYPRFVVSYAKLASALRFGIDWDGMDYLARADELSVPILLFHGDADTTVPVLTSDMLAQSRPDIVTYHRLADTEHVRSWNTDRATYEAAVREFLEAVEN